MNSKTIPKAYYNTLECGSGRKKLIKIWKKWGGKCYWCECDTYIYPPYENNSHPDTATKEHLRSRNNPTRYDPCMEGEPDRIVLACNQCNNERSKIQSKEAEEIRRQREAGPSCVPWTEQVAPLVLLREVWPNASQE